MNTTLSTTSDSPDTAYGVSLIAAPATPSLTPTETANVAHWLREAQADSHSAGAGVPTHCSNVIIALARLVQRLNGEVAA